MTRPVPDEPEGFLQAFGAGIRRERVARGWTQEELAQRAGLHRTFVGAVERGAIGMNLGKLPCLARALRTEPARLVPLLGTFGDENFASISSANR